MSFIARQPNGLLCRWSNTLGNVTFHNLTDEEYIAMCERKAREQAEDVLKYYVRPFSEVRLRMISAEIIGGEDDKTKNFDNLLKEMSKKVSKKTDKTEE